MSELEETGDGHYCALFLTESPPGLFKSHVGGSAASNMSKGSQRQTLATMDTTSIIIFFYPESTQEDLMVPFMICKLGPCYGNTRSHFFCQEYCVSH